MTEQKTLLLIFDNQGICLGEMFFDHDRFTEAFLHPEGELILGDWLLDWQVTGITHCQKLCSGKNHVCALGEHISMRSPEFPAALRAWLERHGLYSLPLPESAWQAWNIIQQLPLLPSESYKLVQALADSDYQDKDRLTASLQELFQELESLQKSPKTSTKRSSFRIGRAFVPSSGRGEKSPPSSVTSHKPQTTSKTKSATNHGSSFRIGSEKSPPLSPKASKPVKPVKSTKTTKPVKKTGTKKPTKLSKSSKPAQPSKLTKSTKPIKLPQPTIKPSKSKKPRKSVKPTKSNPSSSFRIGRAFVPSSGRGEKSPPSSATSRKPVKKTIAKKKVKLSKPPKPPKQSKRKKPTKR